MTRKHPPTDRRPGYEPGNRGSSPCASAILQAHATFAAEFQDLPDPRNIPTRAECPPNEVEDRRELAAKLGVRIEVGPYVPAGMMLLANDKRELLGWIKGDKAYMLTAEALERHRTPILEPQRAAL